MDEVIKFTKDMLPNLSSTQLSLFQKKKFEEIGVDSLQNLKYLVVDDISEIIKTVPARRFVASIKKIMEQNDTGSLSSTSLESSDQSSNLVNSPTSCYSSESSFTDESGVATSPLWSQTFQIPWDKLPTQFLDACKQNRRPPDYLRREAIRILVYSILEVCRKPTSKDLHNISAKLVNTYQDSLGDLINGRLLGCGYTTIMSSLTERINNINRKTKVEREISTLSTKNYGCLATWSVPMDIGEENDLIEKKEWMKMQYTANKNMTCLSTINEYMMLTYPLQRKLINAETTSTVRNEFPYLFHKKFICDHFERLTGYKLDSYSTNDKRKFSVIHFMRRENAPKLKHELSMMDLYAKEFNPEIKLRGFISLLLAYFKESGLIECYQPCTDVKQVEAVKRKCGNIYDPLMHHIVLENSVVATVDTIDEAAIVLFGIYYIFNLEYHPDATQTLEFIQRVLIGINPDIGTKKPKCAKKTVSSKVISLANQTDD